ncbi:MAG TPA: amidohydrolase family protein [Longimicrobiales bacterium]|nr:amidohydrolase family protein [Longimicrobiales bacterium]
MSRPGRAFLPHACAKLACAAVLAGLGTGCDTDGDGAEPALVIRDARVWDGTGAPARDGITIVVRGDTIAAVGPVEEVDVPRGAEAVDADGLFVIPGLWDMHVHALWAPDVPSAVLPLLVAHGITGVRDMGGTLEVLRRARREVAAGAYIAPRIVAAGAIVDGPEPVHADVSIAVETAAEGVAAVDSLHAAGADFIKVYTLLPAEAFEAVARRAAELDLPVAGHVPAAVGPVRAAELGLRSVAHTMNELGGLCPRTQPAECDEVFGALREHGVWQDPVLAVERDWDAAAAARDPRMLYMPASLREYWLGGPGAPERDTVEARIAGPDPGPWRAFPPAADDPPEELWLTRAAHERGLRLLAGTDAGVPPSLPGWSLHEELRLLVEAGLYPEEALLAATRAPAEFLGIEDATGTIEVGKAADLVLLGGDPLRDIRATRQVVGVVLAGAYLGEAALDSVATAVRRQVARRGDPD